MSPRHTTSPWKRQAKTGPNRFRIVDAQGHQVADANTYNEQAESNADLIAAAPELLASLSRLVEKGNRATWPEWEAALNAIAKATGQQGGAA